MSVALVYMPYCPGSVGEQVVQIPLIGLLRDRASQVIGVAPGESWEYLESLQVYDRIARYENRASWGALGRLASELRGLGPAEGYQLRRRSIRTSMLARLGTRGGVSGFEGNLTFLFQRRSIPLNRTRYITQCYLDLIDRRLPEFADRVKRRPGDYALLIPAGRTKIKRYPLTSYLAVARALSSQLQIRFLVGPDMADVRDEIEQAGWEVAFGRPITEVEQLVREASLVIANDCGPAHFGHIYDVPRISLFDRSINAAHWFDAGRNGRLIQSPVVEGLDQVPPEAVIEQATDLMGW